MRDEAEEEEEEEEAAERTAGELKRVCPEELWELSGAAGRSLFLMAQLGVS